MIPLLAAVLVQACGPSATSNTQQNARTQPAAKLESAAQPPMPVKIVEETDMLHFRYFWPAEAAAIPKLDARLRADAKTRRQHALNGAQTERKASEAQGYRFRSYEMTKMWTIEGDAAGLLVLRDTFYEYTGGAHGMSGFESIIWDRSLGRDILVTDLFRDKTAAIALLKQAFCKALNVERGRRRGAPVPAASGADDWENGCPDLAKQVLILSDVKDEHFTSIHVLVGPYEAGPYAEGTYDIVLPATPALTALLLSRYTHALMPRG